MNTRILSRKSTEDHIKEALMPKKILVVDDDPSVVKYLTAFLKDSGYDTSSAADGELALQAAKKEKPDLITLDLQMPNDTGTRFYRNLMKEKELKDTPVIVVSGIPGRHLAVSKPAAVFEKPVDRDQLLAAVKKILGE
jgi:CheY-like chemotaxis protein